MFRTSYSPPKKLPSCPAQKQKHYAPIIPDFSATVPTTFEQISFSAKEKNSQAAFGHSCCCKNNKFGYSGRKNKKKNQTWIQSMRIGCDLLL